MLQYAIKIGSIDESHETKHRTPLCKLSLIDTEYTTALHEKMEPITVRISRTLGTFIGGPYPTH